MHWLSKKPRHSIHVALPQLFPRLTLKDRDAGAMPARNLQLASGIGKW